MSKANKHKIFSVRSGSSPGGGEEDQGSFIQKALKVYKSLKVKSQTRPKLAVPLKKTAYNLFFKDMQEKKELKRVPLFPKEALSYQKNGRRLKLMTRR